MQLMGLPMYMLTGAAATDALLAIGASLGTAVACGLTVTFGGALLAAVRGRLRDASITLMLGFSFAFVLLEWPFVVLIGALLLIGPGD